MSLKCWTKSRKQLKSKIVGTNAPEEERGYRETQASGLRHTESPGHGQRVSGTEGQEQPGPFRPRGCIRNLGFYSTVREKHRRAPEIDWSAVRDLEMAEGQVK